MRTALREGLIVAAAGAALAFAANALSPRGLQLTRDYFPIDSRLATDPQPGAIGSGSATNASASLAKLEAQARELGIRLADSNLVLRLFHDARRGQEGVVFIDARDTEHYVAGHIPGAYQLDYYRKEDYLAAVLPVCTAAQEVVVYCAGGSCEDSLLTAGVLLAPVVPKDRLLVYAGGFTEWTNNRLAVEVGQRNSGQMLEVPR